MRANYRMQRLFSDQPLAAGRRFEPEPAQAHYLRNVLRLGAGDEVLIFNGRQGEWIARLQPEGKKKLFLEIGSQTRPQSSTPDLVFCFAPLKTGRMDYLVQKAVEMGAGTLQPVITKHTQNLRDNQKRLKANMVEAAEQCGILAIPALQEPVPLQSLLANWDHCRRLIFCDEAAQGDSPIPLLKELAPEKLALLIGPEGGFSEDERRQMRSLPFVTAIPLGPRILRADTAAVAALALVQALLGDWQHQVSLTDHRTNFT